MWPFLFDPFFLKKYFHNFNYQLTFTADPKVNLCHNMISCNICCLLVLFIVSRVAQWKRAGPITQRSEDQNLALL